MTRHTCSVPTGAGGAGCDSGDALASDFYGGVFCVLIVDNMRELVAVADPLAARMVERAVSNWPSP